MPRLTVVIPALGSTAALENSLVSALEHRPASCDLVVVHTRPYSDPYELAGEVRFIDAPPGADASECIRCGIAAANSEIVFVLLAGCEVVAGWSDRALKHFANPRVAAVAPRIVSTADRERTLANGARLWPGGKWMLHSGPAPTAGDPQPGIWGPPLAAGFYRAKALEDVGAFAGVHAGPLADASLAAALHRSRWLVAWEPTCAVAADVSTLDQPGGRLRRAWKAQQLAVDTADLFGGARSLTGLAGPMLGEFFHALPSPMAVALLAVRLAALVGARRHPPLPVQPLLEPASAEAGYRRVDRSHSRERRETTAQTLRRG